MLKFVQLVQYQMQLSFPLVQTYWDAHIANMASQHILIVALCYLGILSPHGGLVRAYDAGPILSPVLVGNGCKYNHSDMIEEVLEVIKSHLEIILARPRGKLTFFAESFVGCQSTKLSAKNVSFPLA